MSLSFSRLSSAAIVFAGLVLPGAAAFAANEFSVCTHALPPHSFPTADHQPSGLATEVLLAVAQQLGWKLNIRYAPWMRARSDAEQGACDLIYTILKKPDYEQFVAFPAEHLSNRYNVLIVTRAGGIGYDGNLENFMRKNTIGTYRDKVVSPLFDQLKTQPWARVDYSNTPEDNVHKLLAGRFDAIVENSVTAVDILRRIDRLNEVEFLQPPLLVTPAYIAFSHRGAALTHIAEFDQALKQFKSTAAYRTIVERYEDSTFPIRPPQ